MEGLPRLPKLDLKEWQDQAHAAMDQVLEQMGFECKTHDIQNDLESLHQACMSSARASESHLVKDKFSTCFSGGKDNQPSSQHIIHLNQCTSVDRVMASGAEGQRFKLRFSQKKSNDASFR